MFFIVGDYKMIQAFRNNRRGAFFLPFSQGAMVESVRYSTRTACALSFAAVQRRYDAAAGSPITAGNT